MQLCQTFRLAAREFVNKVIIPKTHEIEKKQEIDDALLIRLAERRVFSDQIFPKRFGGSEFTNEQLGIIHEEFGKGHSSVENILTVVGMASAALLRGNKLIKEMWLPKIAQGTLIPAFALTEPNVGSDIQSIKTSYQPITDGYLLNGRKRWITLGSRADIFIVFAKHFENGGAFIIPKNVPGLNIKPIKDMLGFRGNMLAEIVMKDCFVPKDHLVGGEGAGINIVAPFALDEGRYTTAWGSVGLSQAAMDKALEHIGQRKQFGKILKDHDSVKQMIGKMAVSIEASRQLCRYAGELREQGASDAMKAAIIAKYHASKTAVAVSSNTVQLLGAYGCHRDGTVELFRDAKIFELIEGASEVLEIQIGNLIGDNK